MPSAIRAQIFFISRALTLRRNKPKQRHHWHGAEKIPLREKNELDAPELEDIIRSDSIVRILYSHLHVDDVSNISQTSKAMRVAVLTNTSEGGAERREMICENACENKKKGECWGCQKVICRVSLLQTLHYLQTRCLIWSENRAAGLCEPKSPPLVQWITYKAASHSVQDVTSRNQKLYRLLCWQLGTPIICQGNT